MAAAKKAATKTKKAPAKKAPAKKTAVKKTAAKKAATKKTAKKAVAKKAPARKAPAKKAATKKAPARKTASAKSTAAPTVVTIKHIAADIADATEAPRKQVESAITDFVAAVGDNLRAGGKVRINGLGIFQVRHRPARMGRNPATGESIRIKASKKLAFRPAKDLKESI